MPYDPTHEARPATPADQPTTQYTQYAPYPPPQPADQYPYGYYAGPMPPSTSGWAIASLVCSILGIFGFPLIGSVLGVIFGVMGLNEIKRSGGRLTGHGLATAGVALGVAVLVLAAVLACIFIVLASTRLRGMRAF